MANRRVGRQRAPRRATDWQIGSPQPTAGVTSVPDGATRFIGGVSLSEGSTPPGTIVRIRGCIHIELAAATAVATLQAVGIGCGLFDDRAIAVANAAALPKPFLDVDDEKWMWHHCAFVGTGPSIAVNDVESDGTGRKIAVDIVVDSKAMRKWDENQTFGFVVENELAQGTATEIEIIVFARLLLKLN